ncbi:hypothetical protein RJ639_036882 [Escallonia herrerae]|uniref:INO80 complex subunit B-like conserved region domain-containing protein n=1 Tax=Escallonia herrerae TaxID=1293975 RepID=A0AA88WP56_9ASTE|nr:hypothetical protein RJ639_036882 [Escallonia herrerae]
MESFGGFGFGGMSRTARKKRSNMSRRPRNDSQSFPDNGDTSQLSSKHSSYTLSKASSNETTGHGIISQGKQLNLNQCSSRASYTNFGEAETILKTSDGDGRFGEIRVKGINELKDGDMDFKRTSGGVLVSIDRKSTSKMKESFELQSRNKDPQISGRVSASHSSGQPDGNGSGNKFRKVKLKVGGVTRTIHAKSASDNASTIESSKSSHSLDAPRSRQRLILQDNLDEDHSPSEKHSVGNINFRSGKLPKQSDKHETVRKSKRVPKRRFLDEALSDGDEEIRYLEKLRTSKVAANYIADCRDEYEVGIKKQLKISNTASRQTNSWGKVEAGEFGSGKESKKHRSGRIYEDTDFLEEEELVSDSEPGSKRKKQKKEFVDSLEDSKGEMTVTTRQRALNTGKDVSSSGASLIEFPNGLPPAPPRKQKDKLSEVEQQLKKAEAAQRRRMQVEAAARETEAEAIRKILGQDSSRKKREEKMKKQQEVRVQERSANSITLGSNTVRWVMGPTGTVVTFAADMNLPPIFEPKPCSYPPPREKCAVPSCTNAYKYRDSKLKLPLCSLQCYKAIHENIQPLPAC